MDEMTELQARIKRLDDQFKIFRLVFVILCFVLSSLVALQTRPRAIQTVGIVRARQFAVVDDAGKTVAELSHENGSAQLVLYGASHKPSAKFLVAGSDPSIVFYDEEQKQRAILGTLVGAPTLAMHDAEGKVRALLMADGNSSIFWLKVAEG